MTTLTNKGGNCVKTWIPKKKIYFEFQCSKVKKQIEKKILTLATKKYLMI